jgi:endonuclease YncB( thermonuclease family)
MPTAQGQAAKAYLESLLGAATGDLHVQTIKMARKPKEKTDKYGRYLAVLYDGLHSLKQDQARSMALRAPNEFWSSINRHMVAQGHAKERYW